MQANKHTLVSGWVFWYSDKTRPTDNLQAAIRYEENLKPLALCRSVEEFFSAYCYLKRASGLKAECNLHFFREGTTPMWEYFPNGGCWILKLNRRLGLANIDKYWESILFACVGEELGDKAVGAVISMRRGEALLQVWLSNVSEKDVVSGKIRSLLGLRREFPFYFKEHK